MIRLEKKVQEDPNSILDSKGEIKPTADLLALALGFPTTIVNIANVTKSQFKILHGNAVEEIVTEKGIRLKYKDTSRILLYFI